MQIPLKVKLRIALIAVIAFLAFKQVNLDTPPAGNPVTIVFHDHAAKTFLIALGLIVLVTAASLAVARPYYLQLSILAVPMGLTVWAAKSPNMTSLLLANPSAAERSRLFHALIGDALAWSVLIMISIIIIRSFVRVLAGPKKTNTSTTDLTTHKGYLSISIPIVRNTLALALTVGIAILLLTITAKSGTVRLDHLPELPLVGTVPATGQILFAVAVSFFIAAMTAFYLFASSLEYLAPAPLLVAVVAYHAAASSSVAKLIENEAPVFVPASVVWSTLLPLQFIAVGTLATIAGFWFGLSLHLNKAGESD